MGYLGLILGASVVILASSLWRFILFVVWRPYWVTNKFRKQGIMGPNRKFWSGCLDEIKSLKKGVWDMELEINSHDIPPKVLPHYTKWMKEYGETFLYWFGSEPRLCVIDVELIKQVLSNKFGFYVKPDPPVSLLPLLGRGGLLFSDRSDWARHRRVVNPAFTTDKLKLMTKKMAECAGLMLDTWHGKMVQTDGNHNTIEVNSQFQELTADVISRTAFGSSYKEGKEIFLTQKEMQVIAVATILNKPLPGMSYLPTEKNVKKWKLERKLRNTLLSIIESRLNSKESGNGDDLLGIMVESTKKKDGFRLNINEIIDECKTFFFGGHETTSHLLTWSMFLLSTYPEWQEKLREEVVRECGMEIPTSTDLGKFKLVNMVLLEALRLYCPVVFILRETAKDMNLGGLMIPKGVTISIPFAIIHRDKALWGENANEFRPLRFENGISKAAKHPNALLAFSLGPRDCVGQNFAMLEAKMVIVMILQRFSFSLSADYKHMPLDFLTLQPQNGLPIVLKPLAT